VGSTAPSYFYDDHIVGRPGAFRGRGDVRDHPAGSSPRTGRTGKICDPYLVRPGKRFPSSFSAMLAMTWRPPRCRRGTPIPQSVFDPPPATGPLRHHPTRAGWRGWSIYGAQTPSVRPHATGSFELATDPERSHLDTTQDQGGPQRGEGESGRSIKLRDSFRLALSEDMFRSDLRPPLLAPVSTSSVTLHRAHPPGTELLLAEHLKATL